MNGHVILLNGTSSAGKSTLARAIQEASSVPYLATGLDAFFATVPEAWGGGRGGPLSRLGFAYDRSVPGETVIRYGPVGRRMLRAMHASTAALARAGSDVIVDELLLAPELLNGWLDALAGLDVLFVGVRCPLDVLEARERSRGDRSGLARGHLRTVHMHGTYDIEVDTSTSTPEALADVILDRQRNGARPSAFAELRRKGAQAKARTPV